VLEWLAENDKAAFAAVCQKSLPREVQLTVEQRLPGNLSTEQWALFMPLLALLEQVKATGEPEEVAERVQRALRAEFSKPLVQLEVLPNLPTCPVPLPEPR
jgi:hypothetical protein